MSDSSRLEPMTAGERLHVILVALLPPLAILSAVLGGYLWLVARQGGSMASLDDLAASLQGVVFIAMIALALLALWIGPALRDVLAGEVLVAEGVLSVETKSSQVNDGHRYRHTYAWVTDASGHPSPRCELSPFMRFRLRRCSGRRYRLFIAPHSKKVLHYREA